MHMKWYCFKRVGILLAIIWPSVALIAQETTADTLSRYERKLNKYAYRWQQLIPRYQKLQFAGSMGFLSFGVGWEYGRDHWETDILFGFIPKFEDDEANVTFTLKQNYIPWDLHIRNGPWSFAPLTTGLYMNSILDSRFWKREPRKYPDSYYKFSTRIRFHIFMGQRITYHIPNPKRLHKSISAFYELSTCDLYFISAVSNRSIKAKDYLSLSFGIKLQVF